MTLRRKINWLLVLSLLAAGTAIVLHDRFVKGPDYDNAPLNVWLRMLDDYYVARAMPSDTRTKARDAIRHLGPDALPLISEWLDWKDSLFRRVLNAWVAGDEHNTGFHPLEAKDRRRIALDACDALGHDAEPLIPKLLALATARNPELDAPYLIARIGGSNAPPALARAYAGTNKFIRAAAGVSAELFASKSKLLNSAPPGLSGDGDYFEHLKEYHTLVTEAVTSGRFANTTNLPASSR